MKARLLAACVTACLTALPLWATAFDLQGHRGARGLMPENTLPGFATALGIGVTTLELDTAITRDGVVVVSHDPALNPMITRGADGVFLRDRGPRIRDLTFDDLQRYDVGRLQPGTRYAAPYPDQQPVDGARIPKLADVFALVKKSGNSTVRFAIETKVDPRTPDGTLPPEDFARRVIAEIRAAGMAGRSTILSFDWRTLQVVQREAPEIATVYLTARQRWLDNVAGDPSPWTAGFRLAEHGSVPKLIHAAGGRLWSSYFGDLDAAQVQEAKALGISVLAWTVNAPADIVRMLDLGVDGLISDRPDLVRAEMARRGMALPPATPVVP
ncbi:MAG: glycerophosphodiester phosphodiesterase [Burkholderiaceae bacterium]|nr:glycerophosphodiester phosphodiesterase [Rhodoferax sp.]MCP5283488.1 glycerophosphodiester phosphodiesterase [Burkholderiaceae bacterium]